MTKPSEWATDEAERIVWQWGVRYAIGLDDLPLGARNGLNRALAYALDQARAEALEQAAAADAKAYLNKPYHEMTDDEVRRAHDHWSESCRTASGWSSAYFAAKQIAACQDQSDKRNLGLVNNHKIVRG